ncbi:MAG: regulatory protein RecX [Rikenellaceae bacterium]
MREKGIKTKTPEQALNSLMALCARAEKSSGDAYRLMARWGVEKSEQPKILEQLIKDRFIDDERFAAAYIRDKINLSGWGRFKIQAQLSQKGVAKEIIEEQLSTIDKGRMDERLEQLIERRARTTKYTTKYQLRDKLIRYGASLGYDFSSVNEAVTKAISDIKNEEEECYDF